MNKDIKQFGKLQSTLKKFDCILILRYSVEIINSLNVGN